VYGQSDETGEADSDDEEKKLYKLSKAKRDNFFGAYKRLKEDVYIHGPIAYEGR